MSDLKTSILASRQLPEFIRDEYPAFVSFVEAYYEFLENKQGDQNNDLTNQAKTLRAISDVDDSIEQFEQSFFNTYASLIPRDGKVDKAILIKHILPLYLAKGNEKAFKLLFRMIFDAEIDITYPKNNVLRASDGKWKIDNKFRINDDSICSVYTGNGTNKTFILAEIVTSGDIVVYVNDVITTAFTIQKEYRKLNFTTAPANGSTIKVFYSRFNYELFNNRQIIGLSSKATALIETASKRIITDQSNLGFPVELIVDSKTIVGTFLNGESVSIPIVDKNGVLIDIRATTFSNLKKINLIDGGANYNVGDPVTVFAGNPIIDAKAIVSKVFDGIVNKIVVVKGGAGFTAPSNVTTKGSASSVLSVAVDAIDSSGANSINAYTLSTDIILPYAEIQLSAANYGFPSILQATENLQTTIANALTYQTLTVGEITNVAILFSNTAINFIPTLDADGATVTSMGQTQYVKSFGSLAKIRIRNGGSGYIPGDEIAFGRNPPGTYGQGAAAAVTRVSSTGKITAIAVQPSRLSGTANISNNNINVHGRLSAFNNELLVGNRIIVNNEIRFVNSISNAVHFTVNSAFTTTATNRKIGVFGRTMLGGTNYVQGKFPSISVASATGSGAVVEIDSIASDGEILVANTGGFKPGEILEVQIVDPGEGYQLIPVITILGGNGEARANAEVEPALLQTPGRWTSSDSLLSALDKRIQGSDYYIDYSYVTSSEVEFSKYKRLLKELLHPIGFVNYADLNKRSLFSGLSQGSNTIIINTITDSGIAGKVNVANTIYITGTNTKFLASQSRGTISVGTKVAVNGQMRIIDNIISNTNISVTSAFTQVANGQDIYIVN
jgi:hypothetical protein